MEKEMYQLINSNGIRPVIRIAVFEENRNVRNNIVQLLRYELHIEIVGVYSNVEDFVNNLHHSGPDLVIMDITSAAEKGRSAIDLLRKNFPHIQILIETSAEEDTEIFHALQAGASGYIFKTDLKDKLLQSIREIRAGGSSMNPKVAKRVIEMIKRKECPAEPRAAQYKLTAREREVLSCIVKGHSYKMVAFELSISYETVRSHIKNIYEKLHVASLTELVAKSINFHIV
jgi:DNA-binding NarL/FixJ family response regulator